MVLQVLGLDLPTGRIALNVVALRVRSAVVFGEFVRPLECIGAMAADEYAVLLADLSNVPVESFVTRGCLATTLAEVLSFESTSCGGLNASILRGRSIEIV